MSESTPSPLIEAQAVAEIAAAILRRQEMPTTDLPGLIATIRNAFRGTQETTAAPPAKLAPPVPINRSIKPSHLICLEDGKKVIMLKRYLRTRFQLTPDAYRIKWGLPHDYPMVAPDYARRRTEIALSAGLGTRRRDGALPGPAAKPAPAKSTPAKISVVEPAADQTQSAPRKRGRPRTRP